MRLLAAGERPPFSVQNPGARAPFLLIGDHAGCEVPAALGGLGLPAAERRRHIGWDIGVAALGARLAETLDACFIAQRFSRLVIDCNRDPARPDAICDVSDGTWIAGNAGLSEADRRMRVEEIFAPYHAPIAQALDEQLARGATPILVALHSFTPVLDGAARPWRYGVLHLGASAASQAALAALRARHDPQEVGDNQPYEMDATDYTVPHHAVARGLDYLELEVRQDLLADPGQADEVATTVADVLREVAARRR